MFKWAMLYVIAFCAISGFILFGYTGGAQATSSVYYENILIAAALCAFTALIHWFLYQMTLPTKAPKQKPSRRKTILEQLLSNRPTNTWVSWKPLPPQNLPEKALPTSDTKSETLH